MEAFEFILENWSPRHSAQVALKFGLLLLPIALWWWTPAVRRKPERLVLMFGAATGALLLAVAYVQITRGEFTASLNAWEDSHFTIEIAAYQLSFALVGAWVGLRGEAERLHGVAFALILSVGIVALRNLFGWGGAFPRVAELGMWALGLGVALLTSVVLARRTWLRAQLAIAAFCYAYFALVHLHGWLSEGQLTMGHVGPSLWHDLALPAVVLWVLRLR
jgi:hypothetical protein